MGIEFTIENTLANTYREKLMEIKEVLKLKNYLPEIIEELDNL